MSALTTRVRKLEGQGGTSFERWVRSLSDERLDAEISRCDADIRRKLIAGGNDPGDRETSQLIAFAEERGAIENNHRNSTDVPAA